MNYKKHRIIIGHPANKSLYAEEHPVCECCGSNQWLAIHHRIKAQQRYKNERYTIELAINYNTLCSDCHAVIEAKNERQYEKLDIKDKKPFFYWMGLKGISLDEFFDNYENGGRWDLPKGKK